MIVGHKSSQTFQLQQKCQPSKKICQLITLISVPPAQMLAENANELVRFSLQSAFWTAENAIAMPVQPEKIHSLLVCANERGCSYVHYDDRSSSAIVKHEKCVQKSSHEFNVSGFRQIAF